MKPLKRCGHLMYNQTQHKKNSTFCPQSAFICCACISEQTVIISLFFQPRWSVYAARYELSL